MLKIALCDDNLEELSSMISLMEDYRLVSSVKYEYTVFHNGFELMAVLEKGGCFDIYCLDIIMPNFSGIELGREIRSLDQSAQIIYLTSSPEFAFESYSVRAVNYVLKPITKEKLFFTLDDVLDRMEQKQDASVVVKSSVGLQKILLSNLVFVEAMRRKVIYHTISGHTIECASQFSEVCENLLKQKYFLKPHRSYLINMNYIERISNTEIILQTLASVPIAQGRTKEIKEHYLAFLMEVE